MPPLRHTRFGIQTRTLVGSVLIGHYPLVDGEQGGDLGGAEIEKVAQYVAAVLAEGGRRQADVGRRAAEAVGDAVQRRDAPFWPGYGLEEAVERLEGRRRPQPLRLRRSPARREGHYRCRAALAFAQVGIAVERVITDNGGCYRSHAFAAAASMLEVQRKRTRPFRPQTNGKAEAFNKTLQREWAYRRPYFSNAERLDALPIFLQDYNYARPHTSIGNKPPASRL
jgi:hypothetical protein